MTKFNDVLASWNDATDSDVQGFYQRAEAVKKRLTPMQQQRFMESSRPLSRSWTTRTTPELPPRLSLIRPSSQATNKRLIAANGSVLNSVDNLMRLPIAIAMA